MPYAAPADNAARVGRQRSKRKDALKQLIRDAKKVPCTDCGGRFPYYVMDFDHVRGEKKAAVARLVSQGTMSMDIILDEIAKCEVVCANCHRLRHGTDYEAERTQPGALKA